MSPEVWSHLHRIAIRLHPSRFRDRFSEALARTAGERMAERAEEGRWAAHREGFVILVDLTAGLPGEWLRRGVRGEGARWTDGWGADLRHTWRGLRKRPALSGVGIVTLAVGVGANAAIFSVVDAVLLRPFDVPEAERVVVVQDRSTRSGATFETTGGAYLDWAEGNRTFETMGLVGGWALNLTDPGMEAERALGAQVSASYFDVVGVAPALGRTFRPEENRGGARVLILSDALWRGRYGADPGIVGRSVDVNGSAWEVVGVMPPVALPMKWSRLQMMPGDRERLVWVPANYDQRWVSGHQSHVYLVLGRLAEGVGVDAARADLESLAPAITEAHPEFYTDVVPHVRRLDAAVVGDVRADLWVLFGAVGLVLLVACANLANLLLARGLDRDREFGVRAAVGARRGRLVRLALLDGVVLGALGGILALGAARLGTGGLLALLPDDLPRATDVAVDARVASFTLAVALAAGLLGGAWPAVRAGRARLAGALRSGGRGADRAHGNRAARGLVAAQLALACTLLVGAGLMGRSFLELQAVELGARTDHTLVADLLLGEPLGTRGEVAGLFRRLEERVEALPGVASASVAYDTPVSESWTETFTVADRPPPDAGGTPGANFRPVAPGYFAQMGIPLLRGRGFTEADDVEAPGVVVVNQAFVERWFPDEPDRVLGRRLHCSCGQGAWVPGDLEWEIVGVVGDVRTTGLRSPAPPAMYYSARQAPNPFMRLLVRTEGDPLEALSGVRTAVAEVEAKLPLADVRTLDDERATTTARDRFNALILGVFSVVALVVAAAGVYGVLSYAVARRSAEMGVRLALGARPGRVFGLLLGEGLRMAAVGMVVGAVGAAVAGRVLSGLLFGVRPWDPGVMAAVVATLSATALVAGWVPARRAARTDPVAALKGE